MECQDCDKYQGTSCPKHKRYWYNHFKIRKLLLQQLKNREAGVIDEVGTTVRFMNIRSYKGLEYLIGNFLFKGYGLYRSMARVNLPIIENTNPEAQRKEFNERFWDNCTGIDFCIDIDSDDIQQAVQYALKIEDWLKSHHHKYTMKFSGSRGFHFVIENVGKSYEVYKEYARHIAFETKVPLDLNIYSYRQLWRLEWSKHQKSGLIAIPLKTAEGFTLDMAKEENALQEALKL